MSEVKEKCPRCGEPCKVYVESRGGRKYLYAHHGKGKRCYLGPAGSYDHAEGLLNFSLKGLKDVDPYEVAVNAILRLKENKLQLERLLNVITSLLGTREVIKKLIELIANYQSRSLDERKRILREIAEEARLYLTLIS